MNGESEHQSNSPELAKKRRRKLKAKLYDWKKIGYDVSELAGVMNEDIAEAERELQQFADKIKHLEKIKEKFYELDTNGYDREAQEIEAMLDEPSKVSQLAAKFEKLEEKILGKSSLSKMKESHEQGSHSKEKSHSAKNIDLEKIREEEAQKIREEERKRIMKEELNRIRDQEKEKLREEELEKLRKEEKEKFLWEERVLKQLKNVKNKPRNRKRKKMKCPSCGGKILIKSSKRPLKVNCPDCGKEFTLQSKKNRAGKKESKKIKYKRCPKCGEGMPIISDKRPLKLVCQNCDAEFVLKGKDKKKIKKGRKETEKGLSNLSEPYMTDENSRLQTKSFGSQGDELDQNESIQCPTCKREIPANARVCGYCGSPIEREEIGAKMDEPRETGEGINCPNCGENLEPDAKICGYCGSPVDNAPEQESVGSEDKFELPPEDDMPLEDLSEETKKFKPLNDYNDLKDEPDFPSMEDLETPMENPNEEGTDMITCPKCGELVHRGARFCGACGNVM